MKNRYWIILAVLFIVWFRYYCGIFVIYPRNAIPDGETIIYWRESLELKNGMAKPSFISSIDSMIIDAGGQPNPFAAITMIAAYYNPIKEQEITSSDFTPLFYYWSIGEYFSI